jgi:hypothetical protein
MCPLGISELSNQISSIRNSTVTETAIIKLVNFHSAKVIE